MTAKIADLPNAVAAATLTAWIHGGRRIARAAAAGIALLVALVSPLPLGAQSADGGTGTLVVLNKSEATATFVDVASGDILATRPTGPSPHELAMASDGRVAVGTDYGGRTLTVLDVPGMRVLRTIDLGEYTRPHGVFFLPGDRVVAVTSESTGNVVLVRPADGTVVKAIPTGAGGSHMVAVTGDGQTLFTGDMQDHTVSRLDVASGRRTGSFRVPETPEAITVSADGQEVWVGSNEHGLVSIVDTESGEVDSALTGFSWPYRILLVPERGLTIIPDMRNQDVRFFETSSRTELDRIEVPGAGPQGVALTADRGTLFLSLSRRGQVAVIDLESRRIVRTLDVGPSPDGIGWSPVVIPR